MRGSYHPRNEPPSNRLTEVVAPQEAWYCRVCGIESPDCISARGGRNVIALPCGHEQPTGDKSAGGIVADSKYRGLGYGIPPSVRGHQ